MRVTSALLAVGVMLALAPAPSGAQSAVVAEFDAARTTALQLDIADRSSSAPTTLRFMFNQSDFDPYETKSLQSAIVTLQHRTEAKNELQVVLAQTSSTSKVWQGDLAVGTPNLVRGDWAVRIVGIEENGAQGATLTPPDLKVVAADTASPTIVVSGEQPGAKVSLGHGDVLAVLPEDPLVGGKAAGLRNVTYGLPGITGNLLLNFPYLVSQGAFKEGTQAMKITATDRAGNVATRTVNVLVDTTAPTLQVTAPTALYVGFPGELRVISTDLSHHNLTLEEGGNVTTAKAVAGTNTHTFPLASDAPGTRTFTLRAIDQFANTAQRQIVLNSTIATTDSGIQDAELSIARPVVGDSVELLATVQQVFGVVALPLNVTVSGAWDASEQALVPGPGETVVRFPLDLVPGQHEVTLAVEPPAGVVETNSTNQNLTFSYEVFIGKVTDGNATYHIRVADDGLPSHAITAGGAALPLRLVEQGSGVAYAFDVGGRNVTWSPNFVPSNTSSETAGPDGEGKDSPGLGLVAFAGALALAAVMRRRR